jgi:hypothetical protein
MMPGRPPSETPGLTYRKRKSGKLVPLWRAPKAAIKAGFSIKTWNLSECPPDELPARCQRIWAEAMEFLGEKPAGYDGALSTPQGLALPPAQACDSQATRLLHSEDHHRLWKPPRR